MITKDAVFAAPAYPLEAVFDPTGAGDTFAGGFLGYLASRAEVSDRDLRRAITDDDGSVLRRPIRELMTRNPKRIRGDQLASEAIALMRPHRIDELPVVDDDDRPIGLIDIQDLVVLRMLDVQE